MFRIRSGLIRRAASPVAKSVFVLELVLEHLAHRRTQGARPVRVPQR